VDEHESLIRLLAWRSAYQRVNSLFSIAQVETPLFCTARRGCFLEGMASSENGGRGRQEDEDEEVVFC
jgi:hypothetical protein